MSQGPANKERARGGLSPLARKELDQRTEEWRAKVATEAARRAGGRQAGYQRDPVTPDDVARAVDYVNTVSTATELPRPAVMFGGMSYLLAIVAGYFVNNIDKPWGSIGFAITIIAGVLAFLCGEQVKKKAEAVTRSDSLTCGIDAVCCRHLARGFPPGRQGSWQK